MSSAQDSDKEYTAEDIIRERTAQVRHEIKEALRRVALVLTINDQGLGAYIDAACKVDRKAIAIEELKSLITELEDTHEDFIEKNWGHILAQARNEASSWVGFGSGKGIDLNSLRAQLDSASIQSSAPKRDVPPGST